MYVDYVTLLEHTSSAKFKSTLYSFETYIHSATRCNTLQHAATHCNTIITCIADGENVVLCR